MKAIITRTSSLHDSVEAKTSNDILVVFSCPDKFKLNDEIEFINFVMDGEVELKNHTCGTSNHVVIKPNNVHDLRLPKSHGTSRTPSLERVQSA
ncbi:MAG: hypothetical protein KME63_00315 [Candidatus Thiodiazotropha sp. (ex Clathrolucina costata)]|nr:hypothetical protein [Candidatus Thiodiazotropha taylori]